QDFVSEFFAHFRAARKMLFEGLYCLVIPAREHFLWRTLDVGNMNGDVLSLTDAVQAPDPLFQQFRIKRQIEKDEMVRELEITAFATDFRADENLRAVLFSEPGGVSVALDERKLFVEKSALHFNSPMKRTFDHLHLFEITAEEENFGRWIGAEEIG